MSDKNKILFVEDDRKTIKFALTYLGRYFNVRTATDGVKAWDCLKKERFDCVVLDIVIPVMNGVEVIKKMREEGMDIPVVVVTGRSRLDYAEQCADLRVGGYVNKPYSIVELKERIDALIREPVSSVKGVSNEGIKHPKVSEALDFINNNLHLPICVNNLASTLGISYEHFIRLFKKEVGITPVEHINQVRIKVAMKYLKETSLTIREIMEKAGFNTEQNFFRQFKKISGLTPREFKGSSLDPAFQTETSSE